MSDIGETFVRMEPEAAACGGHVGSVGEAAQVSMAISLKRIADTFCSEGNSRGDVLYWLEMMASAANVGRS